MRSSLFLAGIYVLAATVSGTAEPEKRDGLSSLGDILSPTLAATAPSTSEPTTTAPEPATHTTAATSADPTTSAEPTKSSSSSSSTTSTTSSSKTSSSTSTLEPPSTTTDPAAAKTTTTSDPPSTTSAAPSSETDTTITRTTTIGGVATTETSTSSASSTSSTGTSSPSFSSGSSGASSGLSKSAKNTIIGVVVGVGGAIILAGVAFVAWRVWGRNKHDPDNDEDDLMSAGTAVGSNLREKAPSPASSGTPFRSTLDQYHNPGPVNAASNF
ncbi:hypothetical protein EYB25_001522 [Talaromyces marneffei]|uniref:Cell wall protein, putative n=2 Tax=Talaromyces marneffei TaxID=37727 RepID=B6Q5S1_TALMQ|nr:uncharacterized protein EYB26_000813 [Talaromyces marneffei]EEA27482.1 cell wall protein, putative [Talaromyces marneffei ATCC 18224]KAE8556818.1 hypothetical protein EYB25_001522 [Talaromyces marneffei]QGA13166.1 hypothetical protein EYB26_000813 [Talaromyces marneffei]